MNKQILLSVLSGIILGLGLSYFWKGCYAKISFTQVAAADVPKVEKEIEMMRSLKVIDSTGKKYVMPFGELHAISSLRVVYDSMMLIEQKMRQDANMKDKELYLGLYPYVKKDTVSFYLIATIGDTGLVRQPGTTVDTTKITDYLKLPSLYSSNKELVDKIKSNIFDIGNHYP